MTSITGEQLTVIGEIAAERNKQDAEWGGPAHDDTHSVADWFSFMAHQENLWVAGEERYRLIKIAALAIAAVESIDRKGKSDV
jgi:hypothetical protein